MFPDSKMALYTLWIKVHTWEPFWSPLFLGQYVVTNVAVSTTELLLPSRTISKVQAPVTFHLHHGNTLWPGFGFSNVISILKHCPEKKFTHMLSPPYPLMHIRSLPSGPLYSVPVLFRSSLNTSPASYTLATVKSLGFLCIIIFSTSPCLYSNTFSKAPLRGNFCVQKAKVAHLCSPLCSPLNYGVSWNFPANNRIYFYYIILLLPSLSFLPSDSK